MCGIILLCDKLFDLCNQYNTNDNNNDNTNDNNNDNDANNNDDNDDNDDNDIYIKDPPPYTEVIKNARLLNK